MKPAIRKNATVTDKSLSYAGYRFPPDVISYVVWLYYRFPLSLRMVEELLAARGIEFTYETVRRWSVKFGPGIARRIRSTALGRGDKWHLDEVVVTINGRKHGLWRGVDQYRAVLDVLVRSRRDRHAARRLIPQGDFLRGVRKLLKKRGRASRALITDKLRSYAAALRCWSALPLKLAILRYCNFDRTAASKLPIPRDSNKGDIPVSRLLDNRWRCQHDYVLARRRRRTA